MKKAEFPAHFQKVVTQWCKQHDLQRDDPILLCVELFRIHQSHWDEIRHKDMPSFQEFRQTLLKLVESASAFQRQVDSLREELRLHQGESGIVAPSVTGLILTAILALGCGILIGKLLL